MFPHTNAKINNGANGNCYRSVLKRINAAAPSARYQSAAWKTEELDWSSDPDRSQNLTRPWKCVCVSPVRGFAGTDGNPSYTAERTSTPAAPGCTGYPGSRRAAAPRGRCSAGRRSAARTPSTCTGRGRCGR